MNVRWDRDDDALTLMLRDDVPIEASEMLANDPDVILDFDRDGLVVGIEILHVSQHPALLGALGVHA